MGLLNPVAPMYQPARRPTEDAHGNKTFANLGTGSPPTIECVVVLGPPTRQTWRAHGDRYVQDGQLAVPRGSDIKASDEIQYDGVWYSVVGKTQGDFDHPFTGDDLGWVVYALAGGG